MKNHFIGSVLLVYVACGQLGYCQTTDRVKKEKTPAALVDSSWLEQHMSDPNVRLVELGQTREEYFVGHIPNALFVDWKTEITDPEMPERYNKLSKKKMELLLGNLGISEKTTVVLYDNLDNRLATRLFWMLRYYGHEKIHILNGGFDAWRRAENAFVSDIPAFNKTKYSINHVNSSYCTSMKHIRSKLDVPEIVLIDGRPSKQFTGEEPGKVFHTGTEHMRKGHIPGALNVVWKENLNEDGTFKSVDELLRLYLLHGVTKEKTTITYCNEGLHAAMPWFVLAELLGYPNVQLYDDSMSEWANVSDAPVVIGNRP